MTGKVRRIDVEAGRRLAESWEYEIRRFASVAGSLMEEACIRQPLDGDIPASVLVALERVLADSEGWQHEHDAFTYLLEGGRLTYHADRVELEFVLGPFRRDVLDAAHEGVTTGTVEAVAETGHYYDDSWGGQTEAHARFAAEEATARALASSERLLDEARTDNEPALLDQAAVTAQARLDQAVAESVAELRDLQIGVLTTVGEQARRVVGDALALAYRDTLLTYARTHHASAVYSTETNDAVEIRFETRTNERVRFRYAIDGGAVEEFVVEDLSEMRSGSDDARIDEAAWKVGRVIDRHPRITDTLSGVVAVLAPEPAETTAGGPEHTGRFVRGESGAEPLEQPPIQHHLVSEVPSAVRIGAPFSVIAQITRDPARSGLYGSALSLPPAGPITIVLGTDRQLRVVGETEFTVQVPVNGDSPPVRFAVRAEAPGQRVVRVGAWAGGTRLATVTCQISADVDQPSAAARSAAAPIDSLRPRPGEVTLLVEPDGGRYAFRLLAPPDFYSSRVLGPLVLAESNTVLANTIDTLRKIILQDVGYRADTAYRWVRETGIGLWQELVPDVIKEQFWELHDDIAAFSIVCGDDLLPWELLYPLTANHDAGFLAEQFPVLRQVADHWRAPVMRLGTARYVVPPNAPTNAGNEIAAVDRVLTAAGVNTIPDPIPALDALLAVIDHGDVGLLHFACHNGFSLEGGGSSIRMDGGAFVPTMLNSARVVRRLADRHPLVFVNACHTARVAPYFTRMMGWAGQFMGAGAGAFIGTLWPVESKQASRYAETFYAALLAGKDLGAASLDARRSIRDTADPTWLAYTTYGDPRAVGVATPPYAP